MPRQRADMVLVQTGLFDSRAKAQAAIQAGLVTVDGTIVRKASELVDPAASICAQPPHPYVSRGGVKLAAALEAFDIEPAGLTCLDLGASTGGFTDVLLGRAAREVFAVDVGRGQLHPKVAADARVVSLEGTDARSLTPALVPRPIDLIVADVSFISLRLVLPPTLPFLKPGGRLVALVKPQFEAGRDALGKGGIVKDPAVCERVCGEIGALLRSLGLSILGCRPSPILGGDGNSEFLIGARLD